MRLTVLVTLLNDVRVERTLESLRGQTLRPYEVVVADGGSGQPTLDVVHRHAARADGVRLLDVRGTIAQSRNRALPLVKGDVVVFLDADEVAPPTWLETLTKPIRAGEADFTGGPTRPLAQARSKAESYLDAHDEWFYREVVPRDLAQLPMGNSAWSRRVLETIGGFDESLGLGGEDYDVNLRAIKAGYRGRFVPEAWVWHDQSGINRFSQLMRKKYRYMVGGAMAYLKDGSLVRRAGSSASRPLRFRHRYETVAAVMKPVALLHAVLKRRGSKRAR